MKRKNVVIIVLIMVNALHLVNVSVIYILLVKIVLLKFVKMIVIVRILLNFLERGNCFEGKCFCLPGFQGESCENQVQSHSVVECASQCLDLCLKKCNDHQIMCYTNCSEECNKR